jgi:hypothetical protein
LSKRFNSFKHGAFVSGCLPWEDEDAFQNLVTSCRKQFHPQGDLEEEIVFGIADLYWRKRRLRNGLTLTAMGKDPREIARNSEAGGGNPEKPPIIATTKEMLEAVHGKISFEYLEQRTAAATQNVPPLSVYEPESQLSILKAEAALDRQIKNAIQQLTVGKDYSRLYCTSTNQSEATEPAHNILENLDDCSEHAKPAARAKPEHVAGDLNCQTDPVADSDSSDHDLTESSDPEAECDGAVAESTLQTDVVETPNTDPEPTPTQREASVPQPAAPQLRLNERHPLEGYLWPDQRH